MIRSRLEHSTRARTEHGYGRVYKTNLLVKLLSIVANRIATLDPQGIGMEMEADKPSWCDSLNGLPGLLGSSLCETLELERLCRFLRESLGALQLRESTPIPLYKELYEFMTDLGRTIEKRLSPKGRKKTLIYWGKSNWLKERYRKKTRTGISGLEEEMTVAELKFFLDNCLKLLGEIFKPENRKKILHESGVPYTYFINEVREYEFIWKDRKKKIPMCSPFGYPLVRIKKFRPKPLALFLEGPVHMLRVHPEWKERVYEAVLRSQLHDRKLKMYKVCEPLEKEPFEIGRVRAYTRGWLENESIYLHMEYKWLLEVLRSGLYREFFQDTKTILTPFLDPRVYGRSILEGGSFIVSSAFPDEKLHGQGFQPRLGGATCEMLHIWTIMVAGENPFRLNEKGQLTLKLQPILPGWLFTRKEEKRRYYDRGGKPKEVVIPENAFAFKFLGKVLVTYHNRKRKNTYERGVRVTSYRLRYQDGKEKTVAGDNLETPLALDVREGRVEQIDAILS